MEKKRQKALEQPLLEQSLGEKEIKQSVDKGSKGILYTIEQTFIVGTIPKRKQSEKRRKTIVPIEGAEGEERQTTTVSNVQIS